MLTSTCLPCRPVNRTRAMVKIDASKIFGLEPEGMLSERPVLPEERAADEAKSRLAAYHRVEAAEAQRRQWHEEVAEAAAALEKQRAAQAEELRRCQERDLELQRALQESESRRQQELDAQLKAALDAEEAAAREVLDEWLRQEHFSGVNGRRRSLLKSKWPLHTAVKRRDLRMVKLLLRFDADPDNTDSNGLTPKQVAERSNKDGSHGDIIRALSRPAAYGGA